MKYSYNKEKKFKNSITILAFTCFFVLGFSALVLAEFKTGNLSSSHSFNTQGIFSNSTPSTIEQTNTFKYHNSINDPTRHVARTRPTRIEETSVFQAHKPIGESSVSQLKSASLASSAQADYSNKDEMGAFSYDLEETLTPKGETKFSQRAELFIVLVAVSVFFVVQFMMIGKIRRILARDELLMPVQTPEITND